MITFKFLGFSENLQTLETYLIILVNAMKDTIKTDLINTMLFHAHKIFNSKLTLIIYCKSYPSVVDKLIGLCDTNVNNATQLEHKR